MCKGMIACIKKEPMLKKVLIYLMIILFFMWVLIFAVHYYMMQQIYVNNQNLNKQVIGTLVKLKPKEEVKIVKAVIGEGSSENIKYGEKILKKYGYDDGVKAWNDERFSKNINKTAVYDSIAFVSMVIMVFAVFNYCSLFFVKRLDNLSKSIDNVMDGNFLFHLENNEEGLLSRINTQFYQMSRRIELSMNKLNKEKQNIQALVTDISHQIKTPVSSIKLFNSLLIEDCITKKEKSEFLNTIKAQTAKLEWFTGSLIKLSRLETGMIELKKERKSLRDTVIKAVEEVYSKVLEKNIDVDVEAYGEFQSYHDARWTKEAIINVLENSIKYTDYGGKIKVQIEQINLYVKLDIEDNGIGIPKDEFNNIFKRFFRGKSEYVQNVEGSGVGLYLTRKILEEQGGSIVVDSIVGAGTKFSLFLQSCK